MANRKTDKIALTLDKDFYEQYKKDMTSLHEKYEDAMKGTDGSADDAFERAFMFLTNMK